jgi:hypothetical protein
MRAGAVVGRMPTIAAVDARGSRGNGGASAVARAALCPQARTMILFQQGNAQPCA